MNDNTFDSLEIRWDGLYDSVIDDELDTEAFKELFLDTWRYFASSDDEHSILRRDVRILNKINRFIGFLSAQYCNCVSHLEQDVIIKLAESLVDTVAEDDYRSYRGYFTKDSRLYITVYHNDTREILPNEFKSFYDELIEELSDEDEQYDSP